MATVATARGPVEADELGRTLMHEHVFVLTAEVQQNYPDEWGDEDVRVADAVRRLGELLRNGISTIVDVTAIGQGRNVPRIKRIADQLPDLNIVVATGIYTFHEVPLYAERIDSVLQLLLAGAEWAVGAAGGNQSNERAVSRAVGL